MDVNKQYATAEDEVSLSINYSFKQVFHHAFNPIRTMRDYGIIHEYTSPQYKDEQWPGLAILEFLREFGFATKNQLEQMLDQKGIPVTDIDELLNHYVDLRIMNYFIAAAFDMEIPDDALRIYCLDFGANCILRHFSSVSMVDWKSIDSIKSIRLVVMYLSTVRFYLAMTESKRDDLHYFRPLVDFNTGKRQSRFSADFQIMSGHTPRNFILECIRSGDFPVDWMRKVDTQVAPFIDEKRWEKYYDSEPIFILLAETKDIALEASKILYRSIQKDQFRAITDDELRKGLSKAKFYKFVPADDGKPAKLVAVKAGIFAPSQS